MIFYDCETCGLHGMPVLIQWAEDDGPIQLWDIWRNPISETLELIEYFMQREVCGFNLAFDHFHLNKIFTTLVNYPDQSVNPEDIIEELGLHYEKQYRTSICLKPKSACDLMIHARKGKYQSVMDRNDIRVKKVPNAIAHTLMEELEDSIQLEDIYFARRADPKSKRWKMFATKDRDGTENKNFSDIVLRFAPSSALKVLAKHALGYSENTTLFKDIELSKKLRPKESGFAPFALADAIVNDDGSIDWNGTWVEVIHFHIEHWAFSKLAREYAEKDVEITRNLYKHFGSPEAGDTDSILTCMVASSRWRGFAIAPEKISELRDAEKSKLIIDGEKVQTAPHIAIKYLHNAMSADECICVTDTKSVTLESVEEWLEDDEVTPHPAAIVATRIIKARKAQYKINYLNKLLKAGRFHASFSVVGTLSSRMSGSGSSKGIEKGSKKGDGLNSQGIENDTEVRSCFPLADEGMVLCGGDFDSFEVGIAVALYNDPGLKADLESGKSIHALFGQEVFVNSTYEEIVASKGTDNDMYTKSKQAVFAMLYGGEAYTLMQRLGVPEKVAEEAFQRFIFKYPGVGDARRKISAMFTCMVQPDGVGTEILWKEPQDYIESELGFRRYFTLENRICKILFELGQDLPEKFDDFSGTVFRHKGRQQTIQGATRTAIFSAAFSLQAAVMRAAGNHKIQSTGSGITKEVQLASWVLQPVGCWDWRVQLLNIHDEIMSVVKKDLVEKQKELITSSVENFRKIIAMISMEWKTNLKDWSDK